MRRPATLAQRLTRVLLLCVAAAWVACLCGAVGFVHYEINRNFDSELEESGLRLLDVAAHDLEVAGMPGPGQPPVVEPPPQASGDTLIFRLVDESGRVLLIPRDEPREMFFDKVPLRPGYFNIDGWRVFTAHHPQRGLLLQLADPRSERRHAVHRVLIGLTLPMLAVMAVLFLLLGTVARGELTVLQRLESEIARRGGNDLRPVVVDGMPRELQSVGEHVNRLLGRLADALDVERALSANAAHELRTPLAAARLRLQTALEGALERTDVEAALASLNVLSQRAEKLLQLSRAEAGAVLPDQPVDLARLAATIAEEFWQTPALQARLQLEVAESAGPLVARGDFDALAIALRNLVENGLRYSDGRVELRVEAPCMLVVRDYGEGVEPARLQALRTRHARHSARPIGYGLGLSIVTTIVERHHARLELVSPLPEGKRGMEARMLLLPFEGPAGNSYES
ncbi:sensor histidine kinase [Xylophilus rhododendri]|uniref:histidine kinase n=1 Tax=Xylophilus rhododendri TaxID=2697032 RepID=A0A857J1V5_9BURK|nr:ATP-binding protein [Xylophilus rhododendri]QHI97880.1 sensor histidine kinase [Xylophilus rhododendri]